MKKKIAFHTVGCKLNFSETSSLASLFDTNMYEVVDFKSSADIFVINTCAVTKNTEKKCRLLISKAITNNPDSKIAVIGCYSQLKPEDFSNIDGVGIVLGSEEKFKLTEYVDKLYNGENLNSFENAINHKFYHSSSASDRTRAFLKIQDGCDYFCSYCTIPHARGRSRNAPIFEILQKLKEILNSGVKEIVLTGVNVGDYGKSSDESLIQLLNEIEKIKSDFRIRISSIEPNLITDEIIELIKKSKKIMPHLHIPLQSGNDKLLKLMRRRYDSVFFKDKINAVKKIIPNIAIGIDVILGFPSESLEDYFITKKFIETLDINFIHAFPYSERENTKAFDLEEKVSQSERYRRCNEIIDIGNLKKIKFSEKSIGKELNVLFESSNKKGKVFGYSENYLRVESDYNKELVNKIVKVKVIGLLSNGNLNVELIEK